MQGQTQEVKESKKKKAKDDKKDKKKPITFRRRLASSLFCCFKGEEINNDVKVKETVVKASCHGALLETIEL